MIFSGKIKARSLLLIILFSLFACTQTPKVQEFPDTASPTEEVRRFEDDMRQAGNSQVDALAPNSFSKAQKALEKSRKYLEKQKSARETLHEVALGRSYLEEAMRGANVSHDKIEEVVAARKRAIEANAQQYFPADFKVSDSTLNEVARDLEKNNLKSAEKNREKLQSAYLNLELRAIKEGALKDSREAIDLAVKEGAKRLAPQTLSAALQHYKNTDAFITANRHDTAQIRGRADSTRESALHLLKITRDAKAGKVMTPEEVALSLEKERQRVAASESMLANKTSELGEEQKQAQALEKTHRSLLTERQMNEKYETARAQFSENEAEVYRQGNALTIRLKGLEFPTAKADIQSNNFALLSKVEKVIKDFGDSAITVEGHTDSMGGKKVNDKISQQRAEAIRTYILSNTKDLQPSAVKAIGYGDQKPLATNKTASGRAQNRRVDIRIEPSEQKEPVSSVE